MLAHISGFALVMLLLGDSTARGAVEIVALFLLPVTLWVGSRLPVWRCVVRWAGVVDPPTSTHSRAPCDRYKTLSGTLERCMAIWKETNAPAETKEQPAKPPQRTPSLEYIWPTLRSSRRFRGAGSCI
jgi:hypothetical protein